MARASSFPLAPLASRAPLVLAVFGGLLGLLPLLFIGPTAIGFGSAVLLGGASATYLVRAVRGVIGSLVVVAGRDGLGIESTRGRSGNPNLFAPRAVAEARLRTGEPLPLPPLGRLSLALSGTAGRRRRGTHVLLSDASAPIVIVRFADGGDELWVTPTDPAGVIRAATSRSAREEPADAQGR